MNQLSLTPDQIAGMSFWLTASIAFVGGLVTAFTPCVYPLIPVTVGIMGATQAKSRLYAFFLALSFVGGLALVYTSLGFSAAYTGKLLGSIGQAPWFVSIVAVLFLIMGLSLLGLFEINLPHFLTHALAKYGHAGIGGSFILGAVSGVLAAPCAGPIVVAILGFVAQKSNLLLGFSLLAIFSIGMGTPFLVLGVSTHLLARIPRTGLWTEWIKHICGIALLVAFLIYAKGLVSKEAFSILVAITVLGLGLFIHHVLPFSSGPTDFHTFMKGAAVVFAGVLLFSAFRKPHEPLANPNTLQWISSLDEGLEKAKELRRPVVVDFWAEWCTACHELDDQTYSNPQVQKELRDHFVIVKIDATDASAPEIEAILKKYSVRGLPTVLFMDSSGKLFEGSTITGFVPPEEFLEQIGKLKIQT